jgi:hypothetical protein
MNGFRWEYRETLLHHEELASVEACLNQHGNEGWELVSVVFLPFPGAYRFFFKRPLP